MNKRTREGEYMIGEVADLLEQMSLKDQDEFLMIQNSPLLQLKLYLEVKRLKEALAVKESKLVYFDSDPFRPFCRI